MWRLFLCPKSERHCEGLQVRVYPVSKIVPGLVAIAEDWLATSLKGWTRNDAEGAAFIDSIGGSDKVKEEQIITNVSEKTKGIAKKQKPKRKTIKKKSTTRKTTQKKTSMKKEAPKKTFVKKAVLEEPPKATSEKPKKKKRVMGLKRLETEVKRVLMQLMSESQSDAVRVAAAKALMDKINKQQEDGGDDVQHDEARERSAAVAEARELVAELAALKSARATRKSTVA